ncbi:MAG: cell-cell signaling protein, partial [Leptodesmis sp.]
MSVFAGLESINGLIVGGNRGIGLGFVQRLLQSDFTEQFHVSVAHLYVTYCHEVSTELSAIAAAYPDRLTLIQMDITDEAQIAEGIA